MDCIDDFRITIKEINILIGYAKRNSIKIEKYRLFNKSAIILLCSKFEFFLENFMEEFLDDVISKNDNHSLPESIKEHLTDVVLENINSQTNIKKKTPFLSQLISLYSSEKTNAKKLGIVPNAKFKMGKHGEKEVKSLFIRFGFSDFINQSDLIPFFTSFNSLLAIRNNIVHEDATPSLTHNDVCKFLDDITFFVNLVDSTFLY
jgi:hypothetical protein